MRLNASSMLMNRAAPRGWVPRPPAANLWGPRSELRARPRSSGEEHFSPKEGVGSSNLPGGTHETRSDQRVFAVNEPRSSCHAWPRIAPLCGTIMARIGHVSGHAGAALNVMGASRCPVAVASAAHGNCHPAAGRPGTSAPTWSATSGPTTFQTKGDAQAWLAEERRLITRGASGSSPEERALKAAAAESARRGRTFSVYAEQWLAARVTSTGAALRPSTRAGYRNSLDVHILPRFGALPLDEITTAAVRQWRGQFSATGHDAAGAKAYGLLKAILQTAEDDEIILRNPCRLRGAGHAAKTRESVALSPADLARARGRDASELARTHPGLRLVWAPHR